MLTTGKKTYTYADYAALPEGAPYQLIKGELILNPAPTPYHQIISRNLEFELMKFLEQHDLGEILDAPVDVYFSETEVYQPDLIVILKNRLSIIGEKKIEAAPDFVAEVLSPSTGYYDFQHKKSVYESAGVKEYWLVDPREKSIDILENRNGAFHAALRVRDRGFAESLLLKGFRVDLEKIFRAVL